jgi:hypothetical protein
MPAADRADALDGYLWADGRYHYLNAFAGYLPVDDPQVSITVLLEDVAPGLTGSSGAGPVFSELARLSIRELGVTPSPTAGGLPATEVLKAEPAGRATTTTTTTGAPRDDDG